MVANCPSVVKVKSIVAGREWRLRCPSPRPVHPAHHAVLQAAIAAQSLYTEIQDDGNTEEKREALFHREKLHGTPLLRRVRTWCQLAAAVHRLLDGLEQVVVAARFGEEFDGPGLHGAHRHRNVTVTGDEYNG